MTSANTNSRVIDVDGVELYAETRSGAAPALVFLHYWGGSLRTWQPVLTRLRPDQALVLWSATRSPSPSRSRPSSRRETTKS